MLDHMTGPLRRFGAYTIPDFTEARDHLRDVDLRQKGAPES